MTAYALGLVALSLAAFLFIATPIFRDGPRFGARLLLVAVILIGAHAALGHRRPAQDGAHVAGR